MNILPYDSFINESFGFTEDIKQNYNMLKQAVEKAVTFISGDKPMGGEEFLMEIAMVETYLGTFPNTVRTTGAAGRGAWQLDRIGFEETKKVGSHPSLKVYMERLKASGIDWMKTTWNDCNKPLIGAIAARLLIAIKPFKIGKTVAERGKQWKKHYNSDAGKGDPKEYIEKVNTCYERIGVHSTPTGLSVPKSKEKAGLFNFIKNKGEKEPVGGMMNFIQHQGKKSPAKPESGLVNFISNKGEKSPTEEGGLMNFIQYKGKTKKKKKN